MPADTVAWGKHIVTERDADTDGNNENHAVASLNAGDAVKDHFLSQGDDVEELHHPKGQHQAHVMYDLTFVSVVSPRRVLRAVAELISPEQQQLCNQVAHAIADFGSLLLVLAALIEFGVLLSAVMVARHAHRLRLADPEGHARGAPEGANSEAPSAQAAVVVAMPVASLAAFGPNVA